MRAHCLFWDEAEVSSELILIFNSLIYPYSDKFISHVASKHAVWHLYFCDITIICLEESWFCEKMKIEYFTRFFPHLSDESPVEGPIPITIDMVKKAISDEGR